MPEFVVRKRLGQRSGDWKYRLNRWFYRNRPKITVIAAFAVACLAGLVAASIGIETLGASGGRSEVPAAAPQ